MKRLSLLFLFFIFMPLAIAENSFNYEISGYLFYDTITHIDFVFVGNNTAETEELASDYFIYFYNDNNLLKKRNMSLESLDNLSPYFEFYDVLSVPAQTNKIIISKGQFKMMEYNLSANSPSITNVLAIQKSDEIFLTWDANDPDGDLLTYNAYYSVEGSEWYPLAFYLSDKNLTIYQSEMYPGPIKFRIVASDGFWANISESNTLYNNEYYSANIIYPKNSSVFLLGENLTFEGYAFNSSSQSFSYDLTFKWFSNKDGFIGEGPIIEVSSLAEGTHIISLNIYSGSELLASDSVSLEVKSESEHDAKIEGILFPSLLGAEQFNIIFLNVKNILKKAEYLLSVYEGQNLISSLIILAKPNTKNLVPVIWNTSYQGNYTISAQLVNLSSPDKIPENNFLNQSIYAKLYLYCEGSDINRDGKVSFPDLLKISQNYNLACNEINNYCNRADINNDGVVNFKDLLKVSQDYNRADCLIPSSMRESQQSLSEEEQQQIISVAESLGATESEISQLKTAMTGNAISNTEAGKSKKDKKDSIITKALKKLKK